MANNDRLLVQILLLFLIRREPVGAGAVLVGAVLGGGVVVASWPGDARADAFTRRAGVGSGAADAGLTGGCRGWMLWFNLADHIKDVTALLKRFSGR